LKTHVKPAEVEKISESVGGFLTRFPSLREEEKRNINESLSELREKAGEKAKEKAGEKAGEVSDTKQGIS
jgi:hypothetical protein